MQNFCSLKVKYFLINSRIFIQEFNDSIAKYSLFFVRYPNYIFYGNSTIAVSASTRHRYSKSSLHGLLVDIYMLSKCNYFIGTFSSQVRKSKNNR